MKWLVGLLCLALSALPAEAGWQSRNSHYNKTVTTGGGGGPAAMSWPLFSYSGLDIPADSNTSPTYGALVGGMHHTWYAYAATNPFYSQVIPIAGTISKLNVKFNTTMLAGTWDIALHVNSTTSVTLACQIAVGQQTCTSSASVAVAVGDIVRWKLTPTGTPTPQGSVQVAAVFTATNTGESWIPASSHGNNTENDPTYVGLGGFQNAVTTRVLAESVMPVAGTLDKLYVRVYADPGTNGYWLSVVKNGLITSMQCRETTSAGCQDTTNSVAVVAGDLIVVQACPGQIPAPTPGASADTACTVPVSAGLKPNATPNFVGMRWQPTTAGEHVLNISSSAGFAAAAVTNYYAITGGGGGSIATETRAHVIAPDSFVFKKLYHSLSVAPGGTNTRSVQLRANNANAGSLACSISGTGTSCQDTSNTYTAATNALLDWAAIPNDISGLTSSPGFRIGIVVTPP